ncbi:hypothetical protein BKA69DRAFT_1101257 [Paraphysoderma sedebokerense]|nr:hypothetical protein BKA69DRAFT_1101257 [Paraphysoderma sedebokerense]
MTESSLFKELLIGMLYGFFGGVIIIVWLFEKEVFDRKQQIGLYIRFSHYLSIIGFVTIHFRSLVRFSFDNCGCDFLSILILPYLRLFR